MTGIKRKVGSYIKVLYPRHGTQNVLCTREGKVVKAGTGPGGRYIQVQTLDGKYRTFSESKIVPYLK